MKKTIAFCLFLLSIGFARAGNITVQITSPANNGASDSIVQITAAVQSVYQIASVVATINGNTDTLSYDGTNATGSISIAGLPKLAPVQLIVLAKDVFNNSQSDTVSFVYAPAPVINIISPLNNSNSFPSLHIKASVSSIDPSCTLSVTVFFGNQPNFFNHDYIGAVDTVITIPFNSYEFGGYVGFTAKDKWGRTVGLDPGIFFNNNVFLSEVLETDNNIVDVNYNKVLLYNLNGPLKIIDLTTRDTTNIPGNYYLPTSVAYLTPYGAIFSSYEWNNDSLKTLPGSVSHTAGKYAMFITGSTVEPFYNILNLRDLSTGTNTFIASDDGVEVNSVAPNGYVVYNDANNIDPGITNDAIDVATNVNAITDGYNIVYSKQNSTYSIYLSTGYGSPETDLADFDESVSLQPGQNYQVNNKFVAYTKSDGVQTQVWLRDSTGATSQATFFNSNSNLELLNPNGDIMIDNNGERYLVKKGVSLPVDMGVAVGKLYYSDSTWYVAYGRYLYKLLVDAFVTVNDGDWNNPSTWKNNTVPAANADVIIKNNITVSSNVSCNSLKLYPPGSVNVLSGFNLTILH